ncbi:uncharacterized protein [Leptinotarsa decemlineata]|uniref:uncharacterized protein n=1 Tax=Leptinotarsa decemlineata TaxID=7539 RepID=UPI003D30D0EC
MYFITLVYLSDKMVYKWCVVPQCTSTSINTPQKVFVSVPTNPKRRRKWLQLSRRDPNSILSHTNIFMCEDHFDMEKDTTNYMRYTMGFSKKILLTDDAVPTKFYCQGRKRQLSDGGPGSSRETSIKRQRLDIVKKCLHSENATDIHEESLQKDQNELREIVESEELPKSQDKGTITDLIMSVEKSVQVTTKVNLHYRSKAVQTKWQYKSISTSPFKVSTTSRSSSPFKIQPYRLQASQYGVTRNILLEDDRSDSDISNFESQRGSPSVVTSSRVTDSDSHLTDTSEAIEQLKCLKSTIGLIHKKPLMYVGISKECYFLIQLIHKHSNIKLEYILLCLKKIRLNSIFQN